MSSSSNNFNFPGWDDYVFHTYTPNNSERTNYPSLPITPRFAPPQATLDGNRGAYNPWRSTEETLITGPFGLFDFHVQPNSLIQFLVLNNNSLGRQSPPGLVDTMNWQGFGSSTQQDSRLTQDQQIKAQKKLKKEIYNPVPKTISRRLCLYYRDQATQVLKEMAREKEEDGKRCAVCLEDFEPKEMVMLTPCDHMFHEECIVPWIKSHGHCPVCRFACI